MTDWIWIIAAILSTFGLGYLLGVERGHHDIIGQIIHLGEKDDGEAESD